VEAAKTVSLLSTTGDPPVECIAQAAKNRATIKKVDFITENMQNCHFFHKAPRKFSSSITNRASSQTAHKA
jgi:hypothetical protein